MCTGSSAALVFDCFPSLPPAELSDYNSLNVPPHNRRHQVSEVTVLVDDHSTIVIKCFFQPWPLLWVY